MSIRLLEGLSGKTNPSTSEDYRTISSVRSFGVDLNENTIDEVSETGRIESFKLDIATDQQKLEDLVIRARDAGYFDEVFSYGKRQKLLEFLAGPEPNAENFLQQGGGKIDEYTMHHVDIVVYSDLIKAELEKKGLRVTVAGSKGGVGKTAVAALIASVLSVIDQDTVITDTNPQSPTLSERLNLSRTMDQATWPDIARNTDLLPTAVRTKEILPRLGQTGLRVVPGVKQELMYKDLPLRGQNNALQRLNEQFRNQIVDTGTILGLARIAMANTNSYALPVLATDNDSYAQTFSTIHNLATGHQAKGLLDKSKVIFTGIEEDGEIFFEDESGQKLINKFVNNTAQALKYMSGVPKDWAKNPMAALAEYGYTQGNELDPNKFLFLAKSAMLKNGDKFSVLPQDMGYRTYIDVLKAIYSFLREDPPTEEEKRIGIDGSHSSADDATKKMSLEEINETLRQLMREKLEMENANTI